MAQPSHLSTGMPETQEAKSMKDEIVGIIPQYGFLNYVDSTGTRDSRQLAGIGIDFNGASYFKNVMKDYYLGISTGFFYSHLGPASANFLGDGPDNTTGGGANFLLIPADLKIGYNFTPEFRASVHGGGNVIYRSIANAAILGAGSDSMDSSWKLYPDVGADFEYQAGAYVSLIARPDITIAPNSNAFMGTLGLSILLTDL